MSSLERTHSERRVTLNPRILALSGLVAALGLGCYLLASALVYRLGYPLDDAWIHQAYARNLGERGEFAFLPGQVSAGSTSPLWAVMIAVGYMLGFDPHLWTYFLGWIVLAAIAYTGYRGIQLLAPSRAHLAAWGVPLLGLEWHLVWAAGSGMETLLAALLVTSVLLLIAGEFGGGWVSGLLIGLGAWVRPDLITLLGPVGLGIILERAPLPVRLRKGFVTGIGFTSLFIPYLLFNRLIAGSFWPNTFYAKQAEYAILQEIPLYSRYLSQLELPLVGVGIALAPGLVLFILTAWSRRSWGELTGIVWFALYLGVYAARLPVTYQHGRYIIPAMPIFFLWGGAGLLRWLQPGETLAWRRIMGRVWVGVAGIVLLSFWALGARAYANDVGFIETEMVQTARWVAQNTPPDALIAAHDIGALGYIAGRDLLDMAGLVSPEVIPIIRDETRLAEFLVEKGADYLITFPSWYPELVRDLDPVYQTQGQFGPRMGIDNMAIYRWPSPGR